MSAADTTLRDRSTSASRVPTHERPRRSPAAAFARLVGSEIGLMFGRRRNQVGLVILAAVPLLLGIAVWYAAPEPGHGPAFLSDITSNGMFVAVTALAVEMPLFLPLAVAAVSGDAIAGEAGAGTLRYVLTVPVGRTRLLLAKYLASLVGVVVAALAVVGTGVLVGLVLFGTGPMPTMSGNMLGYGEGIARVGLAGLYAVAALAAVLALGFLVSSLTEQPVGAMIAVVVVTMAMQILGGLSQLAWLHPYLVPTYWLAFVDLFRDPVFSDTMARGLFVFGCYVVVGIALAIWRFRTKDLTC